MEGSFIAFQAQSYSAFGEKAGILDQQYDAIVLVISNLLMQNINTKQEFFMLCICEYLYWGVGEARCSEFLSNLFIHKKRHFMQRKKSKIPFIQKNNHFIQI